MARKHDECLTFPLLKPFLHSDYFMIFAESRNPTSFALKSHEEKVVSVVSALPDQRMRHRLQQTLQRHPHFRKGKDGR